MTTNPKRIERYYDTHELPGSEGLSQTRAHAANLWYLHNAINNIFYGQDVGVLSRAKVWLNRRIWEGPDIAVVDGLLTKPEDIKDDDYRIGKNGPPPRVVIEVTSHITWRRDLEEKPAVYNRMGVNEYVVYGPKNEPVWTDQWSEHNRLVGWRRNKVSGKYELIEKDPDGRLWSEELKSWLVVEGNEFNLYTVDGQLRVSRGEELRQKADASGLETDTLIENRKRTEAVQQQAEAARQKAEAERQKYLKMRELLKKLGYNPDDFV